MQEGNVEIIEVGSSPDVQARNIKSLAMARRDPGTLMNEYGGDGQLWMNDQFNNPAARHLIDILDFIAIHDGTTDSSGTVWGHSANTGKLDYRRTRSRRVVKFTRAGGDDQPALVLDTVNPKAVVFVPGPLWIIPVLKRFKQICDTQVAEQALALYEAESDEQATAINTLKLIAQNV